MSVDELTASEMEVDGIPKQAPDVVGEGALGPEEVEEFCRAL